MFTLKILLLKSFTVIMIMISTKLHVRDQCMHFDKYTGIQVFELQRYPTNENISVILLHIFLSMSL